MPKNRYVVSDLNALDTSLDRFVEPDDQIVLAHVIAEEIATSDRLEKHIEMFPKWIKAKAQQIWIAHEPATLLNREKSYRDKTVGLAWRDDLMSIRFRQAAKNQELNWNKIFADIRHSHGTAIIENSRNNLKEMCRLFSENAKTKYPDIYKNMQTNFSTEATISIQRPELGFMGPERFRVHQTPRWQKALCRFPDIKAIGRLNRILWWNAMAFTAGRTKKFENNHADAIYAFTASYTGHIATDDTRLQEMIKAIFPYVNILQSRPS